MSTTTQLQSNNPLLTDPIEAGRVIDQWTFPEPSDLEACTVEINDGHLHINGDGPFIAIPPRNVDDIQTIDSPSAQVLGKYSTPGEFYDMISSYLTGPLVITESVAGTVSHIQTTVMSDGTVYHNGIPRSVSLTPDEFEELRDAFRHLLTTVRDRSLGYADDELARPAETVINQALAVSNSLNLDPDLLVPAGDRERLLNTSESTTQSEQTR